MNRSAYLTTGLAIKMLSSLSNADVVVHGEDKIPDSPTIFVMNHFTRLETFLLPYYLHNLTGKPVWSLAASVLFKGGLGKFLKMVGAVSTNDPHRDELIVRSLLTGTANWIIFPEGRMVKTKKIIKDGKYMIAHPLGMHEPHTGAAALALRAELFRMHLLEKKGSSSGSFQAILNSLGIEKSEDLISTPTNVVPVNLTYYPIRTAENIASNMASKLVKDIPDRMVEEIMTEGTMLLSGVDIDIRFGEPINIRDYQQQSWLTEVANESGRDGYTVSPPLKAKMKRVAYKVMQRYMDEIYSKTTVNHDHLFATFMRMYPFKRIGERDFKRRVFYAATLIGHRRKGLEDCFLHKSLEENQAHLLTDDRFSKYKNFIQLAEEKGVVERYEKWLIRDRDKLSIPLGFHKIRIDNPIEVMANEIEPLEKLQKFIRSIAWQPVNLLRFNLLRYLVKSEKQKYIADCLPRSADEIPLTEERSLSGMPFLLPSYRVYKGVLLVHSYLAVPEEVKRLATYLRNRGIWVYAVRLPGHGTSVADLGTRKYKEWVEAVENGFALLNLICDKIYVGGVAIGGNLGLHLTARVPEIAGVFAVCPPLTLKDYSTNFMPTQDVWDRILSKLKRGEQQKEYLDFSHGNCHVNYSHNPVGGITEIGRFLDYIEKEYSKITQPALIIQASENPVVNPVGSRKLYDKIGSVEKEYCLLSYNRHVLVNGERAEKVYRKIADFISDY